MSDFKKTGNKICGRLCIEIIGRLASPLSIGSGEEVYSDADVVVNAKGEPYIPGTSLAGTLREYQSAVSRVEQAEWWFGMPETGTPGSQEDRQSRIFVYDATITSAELEIRDGVRLSENKTAIAKGKYDRQYVKPGATVRIRLELVVREDWLKKQSQQAIWQEAWEWIRRWCGGLESGELRLGARSRRGFGKIAVVSTRIRRFNMEDRESHQEWLDWDWDQKDAFTASDSEEMKGIKAIPEIEHCLRVPLQISDTMMIRSCAATFTRDGGIPDYGQLMAAGEGENHAVVPGSSWAGAFRTHLTKIIQRVGILSDWETAQKILEPVFGSWNKADEELRASRIVFEETDVQGGHGYTTSRNAIDRFTGGTVLGALYEERPWAGGRTELCIRWRKANSDFDKAVCGMLLWVIKDLQEGILAIGGETSVGRGICSVPDGGSGIYMDGKPLDEKEQQNSMKEALLWVKQSKGAQADGKL